MSYAHSHMGSGSRTARRTFEFGKTYVVRPKGKHQATIVWLHGLGDNGSRYGGFICVVGLVHITINCHSIIHSPTAHPSFWNPFAFQICIAFLEKPLDWCFIAFKEKLLKVGSPRMWCEALRLIEIKWICPTAPTRPVAILGGFPCTAWFDVGEMSEDSPDDWEGLDASAAHIANLLSTEPADVKVGIGGFSMGAATALYSATCYAMGRYGNGIPYTVNLRAVVGLSGWLPGSRSLRNKIEVSHEARRRAASLPIMMCHGNSDDVVLYKYGEKSAQSLSSAGFRYITFKSYDGLGHYTVPREMDEVCNWLFSRLGLEGSS